MEESGYLKTLIQEKIPEIEKYLNLHIERNHWIPGKIYPEQSFPEAAEFGKLLYAETGFILALRYEEQVDWR